MTLVLDLSREESERLCAFAARQGTDAETALRKLVADLPEAAHGANTLALFEKWWAEDATDDPVELRKAQEELEALMAGINENRAINGERLMFP